MAPESCWFLRRNLMPRSTAARTTRSSTIFSIGEPAGFDSMRVPEAESWAGKVFPESARTAATTNVGSIPRPLGGRQPPAASRQPSLIPMVTLVVHRLGLWLAPGPLLLTFFFALFPSGGGIRAGEVLGDLGRHVGEASLPLGQPLEGPFPDFSLGCFLLQLELLGTVVDLHLQVLE